MAYLDENGVVTLSNQLFTKIKTELDDKQGQIDQLSADKADKKDLENIGNPTDEQVTSAINQAIANGTLTSVGGGLSVKAINQLAEILRNSLYLESYDSNTRINDFVAYLSEGGGSGDTTKSYTVTSNLTSVTSDNISVIISEGSAYTATLTATDGYAIDSVLVTMGGTNITATAYSGGVVNIASVTGHVVITATAVEQSIQGIELDLDENNILLTYRQTIIPSYEFNDVGVFSRNQYLYVVIETTQSEYWNSGNVWSYAPAYSYGGSKNINTSEYSKIQTLSSLQSEDKCYGVVKVDCNGLLEVYEANKNEYSTHINYTPGNNSTLYSTTPWTKILTVEPTIKMINSLRG